MIYLETINEYFRGMKIKNFEFSMGDCFDEELCKPYFYTYNQISYLYYDKNF